MEGTVRLMDNGQLRSKAVEWALGIAADSRHGYDQSSRWGPDYDCSSLVISAWEQAGVKVKSAGATYTGNMKAVFLRMGFRDVTASVALSNGNGMLLGDVLLHERNHTALYIGSGRLVHAAGNERGGITGGTVGDQTGGEITVAGYYNYPWDCVLRYEGKVVPVAEPGGEYTVQSGDNLWTLAERWLGTGTRYREIMELNDLHSDLLHVGQLLLVPGGEAAEELVSVRLPRLRPGDQNAAVESMQLLLMGNGYMLPNHGADGQWGEETQKAFLQFQQENGLSSGVCDGESWAELVG